MPLTNAEIVPRRSSDRKYVEHGGWLRSHLTFSADGNYDLKYHDFGDIMVLNEDIVAPHNGFPTHNHRNAEIFTYILSGELTHRDSVVKKSEREQGKKFYRMKRGDVQFTTGGSGIAHSELNETDNPVHFLQIWIRPWKYELQPVYHTRTFNEEEKRKAFVLIISPLAAGPEATPAEEDAAVPKVPNTIPIHADFIMGAGIIGAGTTFNWTIGAGVASSKKNRNLYVHVPKTKGGKAKIRLDGRGKTGELNEGDGAFISDVNAGDILTVESIGEAEAEVVVLDSR